MDNLSFETGVVEYSVNGGRTIKFNPSDVGFMDTLYSLVAKIDSIDKESQKKRDKQDDLAKLFDNFRNTDKKMRDAVDAVFGDGFCDDVFDGIRLVAVSDGITVLENFVFAVLDKMDESVHANIAVRNDRIKKYTDKYQKYRNK